MQIANRYEVQKELGQGGMGTVYQVYDRLTQETIALKRVNTTASKLDFNSKTDEHMLVGIAREFRILAGLRHPNIVPVLDYGFDSEKRPFFTMQLLDSPQAFLDVVQDKSLEELVNFFVGILQALSYLHQRGIIHRDLKPANVLVRDNQVYVLDFGLSEVTDVAVGRAGTVVYMPPEVMRRARATTQSDLFAAGVMLYQAVSGELPYSVQALMGIDPFVPGNDGISGHPLEMVILRLIAENPEDRYPSAHAAIQALCHAAEIPPPAEDPRIRESFLITAPFVGREIELAHLEDAFQDASEGQGSIWLVGGESGVGKSRLMDEVRVRALIEGAIVVRGRGVEGGGLPYQLWREPLRRLVLSVELDDFTLSVLQEIVPDIASLSGRDVKPISPLRGIAHQQRLITAIVDVFKKQSQTVLLILEDLQWTGESLEPLKQLAQIIKDHSLLIQANYRDDERPELPEIIPGSKVLKLERLSEGEIAALSISMIGQTGTQSEVLELLQRETEGNAFFLVEVVRALAEAAGSRSKIGEVTLPESVFSGGIQTIVQRRLEKVPEQYRPLLQLAAVAGRQIDRPILESGIQNNHEFSDDNFDDFLQKCADATVFDLQDGQWQFTHDKLREYVLSHLPENKKMQLHRQVAEAIEAVYPHDLRSYAAKLSHHWRLSEDNQKESYYTQLAGQQAADTSSYHAAITFFERGLSLITGKDESKIQADLLIQLGTSLSRLGFNERAKESLNDALELARDMQDNEISSEALNILGGVLRDEGDFEQAYTLFEESLELARQVNNQALEADTLLELGWLNHRLALYQDAYQYFSEAVSIYQEINSHRGLATAYNRLGGAALKLDDFESSANLRQKSLALFQEIGDRWGEATALANLGETARLQKDYPVARQYYLDALEIERRIDTPQLTAIVLTNLANVEFATEAYESALAYYAQSLHDALRTNATSIMLHNLVGIAGVRLRLGQEKDAANLLGMVINHPALMGETRADMEAILEELSAEIELNPEHVDAFDLENVVQELLDEFREISE